MAPIGKMFATVPYPFHDSRLALFMFQISVDTDIVCLPVVSHLQYVLGYPSPRVSSMARLAGRTRRQPRASWGP
jgi:hypothetical protein